MPCSNDDEMWNAVDSIVFSSGESCDSTVEFDSKVLGSQVLGSSVGGNFPLRRRRLLARIAGCPLAVMLKMIRNLTIVNF